jgi:hypothetical protein
MWSRPEKRLSVEVIYSKYSKHLLWHTTSYSAYVATSTELDRVKIDGFLNKEGCNWGHGLSAAIKIGTPEKTVGASQLHSGVY